MAGLQSSDRQQTYLARAVEAEEFASLTPDAELKDTWLGIAASYRDLADTTLQTKEPTHVPVG